MLITTEVELRIPRQHVKHYRKLGYTFNLGEIINVKVEHLTKGCNAEILILCDYCNKKTIKRPYCTYLKRGEESPIKKDACKNCAHLKTKETNEYRYGVSHVMKIKEVAAQRATSIAINFEIVKDSIEKENYILLTSKSNYKNADTELDLVCPEGHPIKKKFVNWKHGNSRCGICASIRNAEKLRLDGNFVIQKYFENSFIPLFTPNEYINATTPMPCYCQIHPEKIIYKRYVEIYNGQGCSKCKSIKIADKTRLDQSFVFSEYLKLGLEVTPNQKYINNRTKIKCRCIKHDIPLELEYSRVQQGHGCWKCGYESYSGENNHSWKNGITPILNHLRGVIKEWKKNSMSSCGYKCIITGECFDVIHHLYSFNKIVQEAFDNLKLDIRECVNKYSEEEINKLENEVILLHEKYPLGVCLTKQVHNLFHSFYGYGNNTPDQFEEFKTNYADNFMMIVNV